MAKRFPPPNANGLVASVAIAVAVTVAVNGLIFAIGWAAPDSTAARPLLPKGWVIGAVWTGLIALLAAAWWALASSADREARRVAPWTLAFIAFCIAYPFYTLGFSSAPIMLAANLATIALDGILVGRLWTVSRGAAVLAFPVAPWVCFATYASVSP
ncbi:MAG: tryptophan-rich sensory protein [Gemmatimonas sp.]